MKPKAWNLGVVLICASAFSTGIASAQSFPSKPIRWIVPFPAGGTGDLLVRHLSGPMAKSLGQNVIADFRPGGSTIVGTELAARAPADGHTLLFVSNSFASNPAVRPKLPYDTLKDFAGVARIVTTPFIIVVHPSVPAKSLKELIALARARPGELTFGSLSPGGAQHLAMEMIAQSAKVSLIQVPHQGIAPMMVSLVGGHIGIAVTNVPDTVPYTAAGRLRPIAVTSASRSPALEDVPTVAESGFPGYDFQLWIGAAMVRAAPREAVSRLSSEIIRALEHPGVKEALAKVGFVPAPLDPEQFDAFIRTEMRVSEKIARQANIRIE
jgi:tripartite-type tricarboxylate transporter receptor subunit TctC